MGGWRPGAAICVPCAEGRDAQGRARQAAGGTEDLLSLVGLLGADNFDDSTLEILEQLDRGTRVDEVLSGPHSAAQPRAQDL